VIARQAVAVAVVGVQEVVGAGAFGPELLDHAAEAIETRVLVAAVWVAARDDVSLVNPRLRVRTLDNCPETQVGVRLQSGRAVRKRGDPADAVVHAAVVTVIQHAAIWVSHADDPTG